MILLTTIQSACSDLLGSHRLRALLWSIIRVHLVAVVALVPGLPLLYLAGMAAVMLLEAAWHVLLATVLLIAVHAVTVAYVQRARQRHEKQQR